MSESPVWAAWGITLALSSCDDRATSAKHMLKAIKQYLFFTKYGLRLHITEAHTQKCIITSLLETLTGVP